MRILAEGKEIFHQIERAGWMSRQHTGTVPRRCGKFRPRSLHHVAGWQGSGRRGQPGRQHQYSDARRKLYRRVWKRVRRVQRAVAGRPDPSGASRHGGARTCSRLGPDLCCERNLRRPGANLYDGPAANQPADSRQRAGRGHAAHPERGPDADAGRCHAADRAAGCRGSDRSPDGVPSGPGGVDLDSTISRGQRPTATFTRPQRLQ